MITIFIIFIFLGFQVKIVFGIIQRLKIQTFFNLLHIFFKLLYFQKEMKKIKLSSSTLILKLQNLFSKTLSKKNHYNKNFRFLGRKEKIQEKLMCLLFRQFYYSIIKKIIHSMKNMQKMNYQYHFYGIYGYEITINVLTQFIRMNKLLLLRGLDLIQKLKSLNYVRKWISMKRWMFKFILFKLIKFKIIYLKSIKKEYHFQLEYDITNQIQNNLKIKQMKWKQNLNVIECLQFQLDIIIYQIMKILNEGLRYFIKMVLLYNGCTIFCTQQKMILIVKFLKYILSLHLSEFQIITNFQQQIISTHNTYKKIIIDDQMYQYYRINKMLNHHCDQSSEIVIPKQIILQQLMRSIQIKKRQIIISTFTQIFFSQKLIQIKGFFESLSSNTLQFFLNLIQQLMIMESLKFLNVNYSVNMINPKMLYYFIDIINEVVLQSVNRSISLIRSKILFKSDTLFMCLRVVHVNNTSEEKQQLVLVYKSLIQLLKQILIKIWKPEALTLFQNNSFDLYNSQGGISLRLLTINNFGLYKRQ
ncbi:unnamed protein product [Paramecium primaurelia]|uniref:Uncharacterized protein n=1 Tax=Paramecium primaurelia TaxID=5886 RepID=A0A8S1QQY2_PARPR|nr:unnamed protein product [Paramecium primaurelia]